MELRAVAQLLYTVILVDADGLTAHLNDAGFFVSRHIVVKHTTEKGNLLFWLGGKTVSTAATVYRRLRRPAAADRRAARSYTLLAITEANNAADLVANALRETRRR